jgi:acyl-coenzyme A synthetase/AMP-(fatty) acid ligase
MKAIETVIERMGALGDAKALFWNSQTYSYSQLLTMIDDWDARLSDIGIHRGSICGFVGEYSPQVCALIFSLMKKKAILVPFTPEMSNELDSFMDIAGVEILFEFTSEDDWSHKQIKVDEKKPLIESFLAEEHPGLIVFSSGSTGQPKGILQDCERVMKKVFIG